MQNNIKETKEFFNQMAESWDKREKSTYEDLKAFLSFLPIKKNDSVLDVGCGTGIITKILQELSESLVIGIDLSDKMINIANNKNSNPDIKFYNKSLYECSGIYDDVVVFNAFPHFVDLDYFKESVKRIIKKDGFLVIAHNLSREKLDTHHHALSKGISRHLNPVLDEYKLFENDFILIDSKDNDKEFYMVLKRK